MDCDVDANGDTLSCSLCWFIYWKLLLHNVAYLFAWLLAFLPAWLDGLTDTLTTANHIGSPAMRTMGRVIKWFEIRQKQRLLTNNIHWMTRVPGLCNSTILNLKQTELSLMMPPFAMRHKEEDMRRKALCLSWHWSLSRSTWQLQESALHKSLDLPKVPSLALQGHISAPDSEGFQTFAIENLEDVLINVQTRNDDCGTLESLSTAHKFTNLQACSF